MNIYRTFSESSIMNLGASLLHSEHKSFHFAYPERYAPRSSCRASADKSELILHVQRDFCVDPSFIVLGFAADFPLQVTVVDEGRRRRDEAKKTVLSELSGLSKSRELSAVGLKHTRMRKTPSLWNSSPL